MGGSPGELQAGYVDGEPAVVPWVAVFLPAHQAVSHPLPMVARSTILSCVDGQYYIGCPLFVLSIHKKGPHFHSHAAMEMWPPV